MYVFDTSFWRDRRVFVTGHTGFKGAWLVLWLTRLGAKVTGLSLPPHTDPSLFALCVRGRCANTYGDIADYALVARTLADCEPEIVIHMAAQALVRPSYADPLGTYATNVMGTANVLQVVRSVPSVRAVIVVTSDKVYEKAVVHSPRTTALAVAIPIATPKPAPSSSPIPSASASSAMHAA
jgi:CDP-glucose 4,6-dehydratase